MATRGGEQSTRVLVAGLDGAFGRALVARLAGEPLSAGARGGTALLLAEGAP